MANKYYNIKEYRKNLRSSAKGIIVNQAKNLMPGLTETVISSRDVYKELRSFDFNYGRRYGTQYVNKYKNVLLGPLKDFINNAKDDLKSGKFYNEERTAAAEKNMINSMMDGFGDMYDDDMMTDDEYREVRSTSKFDTYLRSIGSSLDGRAVSNSLNEVNINNTDYMVNSATMNNSKMMALHIKHHAEQINHLKNIESIGMSLVKFNEEIVASAIERQDMFHQDILNETRELKELIREQTEYSMSRYKSRISNSPRQSALENMLSSYGSINIKEYFKNVKGNIRNELDILPFDASMLKSLMSMGTASPISMLINLGLSSLFPQSQKGLKNLDKRAMSLFGSYLLGLNNIKYNGKDSFGRTIASILGVDMRSNNKPNLAMYKDQDLTLEIEQKKAKAITEVIPSYLSKIVEAMTGVNVMYDYSRGIFVDKNKRKIEAEKDFRSSLTSDMFDTKYAFEKKLLNVDLTKEQNKYISEDIANFVQYLATYGDNYDTSLTYAQLKKRGLKLNGGERSYKLIRSMYNAMSKTERMNIRSEQLASMARRPDVLFRRDMDLQASGNSSLYNGIDDLIFPRSKTTSKNAIRNLDLNYFYQNVVKDISDEERKKRRDKFKEKTEEEKKKEDSQDIFDRITSWIKNTRLVKGAKRGVDRVRTPFTTIDIVLSNLVDKDNFKNYMNKMGYESDDELIESIASMNNEQFNIFLSELTTEEKKFVRTIRTHVRSNNIINNARSKITSSNIYDRLRNNGIYNTVRDKFKEYTRTGEIDRTSEKKDEPEVNYSNTLNPIGRGIYSNQLDMIISLLGGPKFENNRNESKPKRKRNRRKNRNKRRNIIQQAWNNANVTLNSNPNSYISQYDDVIVFDNPIDIDEAFDDSGDEFLGDTNSNYIVGFSPNINASNNTRNNTGRSRYKLNRGRYATVQEPPKTQNKFIQQLQTMFPNLTGFFSSFGKNGKSSPIVDFFKETFPNVTSAIGGNYDFSGVKSGINNKISGFNLPGFNGIGKNQGALLGLILGTAFLSNPLLGAVAGATFTGKTAEQKARDEASGIKHKYASTALQYGLYSTLLGLGPLPGMMLGTLLPRTTKTDENGNKQTSKGVFGSLIGKSTLGKILGGGVGLAVGGLPGMVAGSLIGSHIRKPKSKYDLERDDIKYKEVKDPKTGEITRVERTDQEKKEYVKGLKELDRIKSAKGNLIDSITGGGKLRSGLFGSLAGLAMGSLPGMLIGGSLGLLGATNANKLNRNKTGGVFKNIGSWKGSVLGALAGNMLMGPILGPLVGGLAGELLTKKEDQRFWKYDKYGNRVNKEQEKLAKQRFKDEYKYTYDEKAIDRDMLEAIQNGEDPEEIDIFAEKYRTGRRGFWDARKKRKEILKRENKIRDYNEEKGRTGKEFDLSKFEIFKDSKFKGVLKGAQFGMQAFGPFGALLGAMGGMITHGKKEKTPDGTTEKKALWVRITDKIKGKKDGTESPESIKAEADQQRQQKKTNNAVQEMVSAGTKGDAQRVNDAYRAAASNELKKTDKDDTQNIANLSAIADQNNGDGVAGGTTEKKEGLLSKLGKLFSGGFGSVLKLLAGIGGSIALIAGGLGMSNIGEWLKEHGFGGHDTTDSAGSANFGNFTDTFTEGGSTLRRTGITAGTTLVGSRMLNAAGIGTAGFKSTMGSVFKAGNALQSSVYYNKEARAYGDRYDTGGYIDNKALSIYYGTKAFDSSLKVGKAIAGTRAAKSVANAAGNAVLKGMDSNNKLVSNICTGLANLATRVPGPIGKALGSFVKNGGFKGAIQKIVEKGLTALAKKLGATVTEVTAKAIAKAAAFIVTAGIEVVQATRGWNNAAKDLELADKSDTPWQLKIINAILYVLDDLVFQGLLGILGIRKFALNLLVKIMPKDVQEKVSASQEQAKLDYEQFLMENDLNREGFTYEMYQKNKNKSWYNVMSGLDKFESGSKKNTKLKEKYGGYVPLEGSAGTEVVDENGNITTSTTSSLPNINLTDTNSILKQILLGINKLNTSSYVIQNNSQTMVMNDTSALYGGRGMDSLKLLQSKARKPSTTIIRANTKPEETIVELQNNKEMQDLLNNAIINTNNFTADPRKVSNKTKESLAKNLNKDNSSGIKSFFSNVWNGAKNLGSKAWSGIKSTASNVWSGIKSAASNAWNGAKNLGSKALNFITGGRGDDPDYYNQQDPRWSNMSFGRYNNQRDTVGEGGCGPTTAATVLQKMTGRTITPAETSKFALQNGYKVDNGGTTPDYFTALGNKYGVSMSQRSPYSSDTINSLKSGKPVIFLGRDQTGTSPFGSDGHYVIGNGVDKNGNVNIMDPKNRSNNRKYNIKDIIANSTQSIVSGGRGSSNRKYNGRGNSNKEGDEPMPGAANPFFAMGGRGLSGRGLNPDVDYTGNYKVSRVLGQPVKEGTIQGSGYGDPGHHGVDVHNSRGTPILAADDGIIDYAEYGNTKWRKEKGKYNCTAFGVRIKLDTPIVVNGEEFPYVYYTHMQQNLCFDVPRNSSNKPRVKKGDVLGYMGIANCAHLHVSVAKSNGYEGGHRNTMAAFGWTYNQKLPVCTNADNKPTKEVDITKIVLTTPTFGGLVGSQNAVTSNSSSNTGNASTSTSTGGLIGTLTGILDKFSFGGLLDNILGGVSGIFGNSSSNTSQIASSNNNTSSIVSGSVSGNDRSSGFGTTPRVGTTTLPEGLGTARTYMGWQCITNKSSDQYKLREESGMHFDSDGYGKIGDRYVVAMTSTFGNVGDYVDIHRSDGSVLHAIIGDEKSQSKTAWDQNPANKWGHENGKIVEEFIVNKDTWYKNGKGNHGNPGTDASHPEWKGLSVTKVENLGNYWGRGSGLTRNKFNNVSTKNPFYGRGTSINNSTGKILPPSPKSSMNPLRMQSERYSYKPIVKRNNMNAGMAPNPTTASLSRALSLKDSNSIINTIGNAMTTNTVVGGRDNSNNPISLDETNQLSAAILQTLQIIASSMERMERSIATRGNIFSGSSYGGSSTPITESYRSEMLNSIVSGN